MFDRRQINRQVLGETSHAKGPPTNLVWHGSGSFELSGLEVGNLHDGSFGATITGDTMTAITVSQCWFHDIDFPAGRNIHANALRIKGGTTKPTRLVVSDVLFERIGRADSTGCIPLFIGDDRKFESVTLSGISASGFWHPILLGSFWCPVVLISDCPGLVVRVDCRKGMIGKIIVKRSPGLVLQNIASVPVQYSTDTPTPPKSVGPVASMADVTGLVLRRTSGDIVFQSDANGPIELPWSDGFTYRFKRV